MAPDALSDAGDSVRLGVTCTATFSASTMIASSVVTARTG
jgi:hypothetical protein